MAWISHSYLMKLWRDAFIRLERILCEPVTKLSGLCFTGKQGRIDDRY